MQKITLNRYLYDALQKKQIADDALFGLLETIATTCISISNSISKGAINDILGTAGSNNIQGEEQQKLDIIANEALLNGCEWRGVLSGMASEEMPDPYPIKTNFNQGEYLLLFDPLDGSSNIDVNISIGTIFSVLRKKNCLPINHEHFLQSGTNQIAAGYVLYGPQTMMVLSFGHGVSAFTFDRDSGSFVLTHPDLKIANSCAEFAINMSNQRHWEDPVQRYIGELIKGKTGSRGKNFNMRWVASMVAEVHRILMRGGVFAYPRDSRNPEKEGKLRLMYEANPMSFLIEQAGGLASNGYKRILEIKPTELHQRVAVFLGAAEEINLINNYHSEHKTKNE